jgi:chemotaxis protein MotB
MDGGEGLLENHNESSLIRNDLEGRNREAEVWDALKNVSTRISRKLEGMQSFARFKDQIEIELTADGLRIQLIEAGENRSFFDRGSAAMSKDGMGILSAISAEIAALPFQVVIEGHTDSRKYPAGAEYTNWELSADRANTARRVMLDAGMTQDRIKEIRGFAANQPRIKDNPGDPANRRIAIIVLNEYAAGDYSEVVVSADEELELP